MSGLASGPTFCHRLSGSVKLLLTVGTILVGGLIPARLWPITGLLIVGVFVAHSLARVAAGYLLRRLAVFLPVMGMLAISLPAAEGFQRGGSLAVTILLRGTLSFLAVLWLAQVMPISELLATLRRWRVPAVLLAIVAFTHRYLFVLWDELERMRSARRARSFGAAGFWFRWRVSAQMIGQLLIRSMDRADRVYAAMCARGWDGQVRIFAPPDSEITLENGSTDRKGLESRGAQHDE